MTFSFSFYFFGGIILLYFALLDGCDGVASCVEQTKEIFHLLLLIYTHCNNKKKTKENEINANSFATFYHSLWKEKELFLFLFLMQI